MSPSEFIELITVTRGGIGGHVSNFTTVLFAYLVMTYLVGGTLKAVHAWGITILYSVYQYLPAVAAFQEINMLAALLEQFRSLHPTEASIYIPFGQTNPIPFALIAVASWLLSIWYMLHQRRRDGGNDA